MADTDARPADAEPAAAAPPAGPAAGRGGPGWWVERGVLVATWVVVLLGSVLRIRQWAPGRAFWMDELLLQRAMSQQSMSELLTPLGIGQSAPPGWLAIQHVVLDLSGDDERAARVLPLLCGIGALVLTALLARTLLGGPAALVATAVVAVSPQLIGYSAEFKQYSSDVFWVLLVVLLGVRVALRRGRPKRAWVALGAVGAVTVWVSHPGALVTVGVFAALALVAVARRSAPELGAALACAVPAGAGLVVEWAVLLRRNAADDYLQDYWARTFPPDPLTWAAAVDWARQRATVVRLTTLFFLDHPVLLLVLLLAGLGVLAVSRPPALALLLVPTAVIAAAGLARAYPIANRLVLFFVPLVALAIAAPLDLPRLAARLPWRAARRAAIAATALLAAAAAAGVVVLVEPQVIDGWRGFQHPQEKQESRTVLAAVAARRGPRDLLLVDGRGARFAAAFYAPRVGAGPFQVLEPAPAAPGCLAVPLGARLWREHRYDRVWLLVSHTRPAELALYLAQLARFGPVAEVVPATGAAVFRFDRSAAPVRPPRAPAQRCLDMRPAALTGPAGPVR